MHSVSATTPQGPPTLPILSELGVIHLLLQRLQRDDDSSAMFRRLSMFDV